MLSSPELKLLEQNRKRGSELTVFVDKTQNISKCDDTGS
jgi:hypothetical protein